MAYAAVLLLCGSHSASAGDFCALTLDVIEQHGMPVTGRTWVELIDQKGNVEFRKEMEGPRLEICDFGFGPHVLRVGTNECLPVSISNVRLVIGSPLHLIAVQNSCGYREALRSGCLLYLRAIDETGKPVPQAEVVISPPTRPMSTDNYGRYQTLFQGAEDIAVTKEGFDTARITASCKANEEVDIEATLRRSKGQ